MKKLLFRAICLALAGLIALAPAALAAPEQDCITVFLDADEVNALAPIPGARILLHLDYIDAVAASVPASALPRLQSGTRVYIPATFAAPAAETAEAAAASLDHTLRGANETDGEGAVIAVIDTGFAPSHEVFSLPEGVTPALTRDAALRLALATKAAEENRLGPNAMQNTYLSEKIPYAFDYAEGDTEVRGGLSSHGTHVAALCAGYSETQWGVAPAAQLLFMKVFTNDSLTTGELSLVAAIADAITLGADVINMSLGALTTTASDPTLPYLSKALLAAEEAGITVVCAGGNTGETGAGGETSNFMTVKNPDTGLPAEPAANPSALGVGAAVNGVTYFPALTVGDTLVPYSDTAEVNEGLVPPFRSTMGGTAAVLEAVPGVGTKEDFALASVAGKIAIVMRGEISFAEKAENATEAGAIALIVVNGAEEEDIIMTMERIVLPSVFVSYEAGQLLLSHVGEEITVPSTLSYRQNKESEIAAFSSKGPTADMALTVDVTAIGGGVVSAVRSGGYDAMNGTSMAAPQIAGLAAVYRMQKKDYLSALPKEDVAAAVRAALGSAATPMTDAWDVPLSVRAQGSGLLSAATRPGCMDILLTGETGDNLITLGDHLPGEGGRVTFAVTLSNTGDAAKELSLCAVFTTENCKEIDGAYYVTGTQRTLPGEITVSETAITLAPGEKRTVTVTFTPDAAFLEDWLTVFENGFYLEGYLTATEAGAHVASVPVFGFFGDWNSAPLLDELDFDGGESFYGIQTPYIAKDGAFYRPLGEDSELFAISPNGDYVGEELKINLTPLRHIRTLQVEVFDEKGQSVATHSLGAAPKAYYDDGIFYSKDVVLWDGTDGLNEHYRVPDGAYTLCLTATSYTGVEETVEFPVRVDTRAPELTVTLTGRTVTATAADESGLVSFAVFTPERVPAFTPSEATVARELRYRIPDGAEILYIRAEDSAGNVTYRRYYVNELLTEKGEMAA